MPSGDLRVDPRGPRVAAAGTSLVLALVLLTSSTSLLAAQAVVFALGAALGPSASPWSPVFRSLVRPRLGPPAELEDRAPLRTAQVVGLALALGGVLGGLLGADTVLLGAAAAALLASLLKATAGVCLGCELHLRVARRARRAPPPTDPAARPAQAAPTPTTQEVAR